MTEVFVLIEIHLGSDADGAFGEMGRDVVGATEYESVARDWVKKQGSGYGEYVKVPVLFPNSSGSS